MKKILVFAQSNVGGAERMTVTVTKTLDRNLFKVVYYLVDLTGEGKNQLRDFIPVDIEVHIIPRGNAFKIMWNLFNIIRREKPDTVFSSVLYLNNKILPWRSLFPRTKFIIRCENYLYTYSSNQYKLIKMSYPKADLIIAQTDEMKQELVEQIGIEEDKIVVLQNPLDCQTIDMKVMEGVNPYSADMKINFVAVGRFAFQKGFDILIKAYAEVVKQIPESSLYIVGEIGGIENEVYQQVISLTQEHGLQDKVHCVGFQTNPYNYIKYADCFVLSSRWEGLPNVLIEALYLGTPSAATTCIPIIERIVENGKNGYLAETENPKSLAEAMLKASKLERIKSTYKSATMEDFTKLFES